MTKFVAMILEYHMLNYFDVCLNKRPSIIPNYIIPSEYEMLGILSKKTRG
jgi:hypothetical protein